MITSNLFKKRLVKFLTNETSYHRIKFWKILIDYILFKKYDSIINILPGLIEPEGTIIDIGANMGQWMMPLSKKCHASSILSFEPIPVNYKFLFKATKILKLQNVSTFDFAFSDETGKQKMLIPYINNVPITTQAVLKNSQKDRSASRFDEIEIQTQTIDNFVEAHIINNISLIKIDTEGAEDKVIKGGMKTILKFRPLLVIETKIENIEVQKLLNLGYKAYYFINNKLVPYESEMLSGDLILKYDG